MAFTVKDIIEDAHVTMQDTGAVRWTQPEILSYINMAIREIVAKKPSAVTSRRILPMVLGVHQTLPTDCTILCRVFWNRAGADNISKFGAAIRVLANLEMLNSIMPYWSNSDAPSVQKEVGYVIYDAINPRQFMVAPANNGSGFIEVMVGVKPSNIAAPANPLVNDSYAAINIPLPDIYQSMVLDFVVYRAMLKDAAAAGAKERALAHKTLFEEALAAVGQNEFGASVAAHMVQQGQG